MLKNKIHKYLAGMINISAIFFLQSCMSDIKPKTVTAGALSATKTSGYAGCTVATGMSTSTIQVSFAFPSNASEVSVYRDGISVLTTQNRLNTSFTDINLAEGQTYNYVCVATMDGLATVGDRNVDGTTLAVNPPTFSGISTITALSSNSVKVTWPATTGGAVAKEFRIYGTMNSSTDFTANPKASMSYGVYSVVITGLADDMPYNFSVRACNATGLCDSNTKALSLTMPDGGAPTTIGATSVALYNGVAQITVPWVEANGAVLKRRLYRSTTNNATSILSNLIKTVNVTIAADLAHPPTIIEDNTIGEGQTYYYIERDEDPNGNITSSSNIVSLTIGDLTAPIFSGLSSIALDSPAETSVLLGWTAISNQPATPSGATYYLLYRTEALLPVSPADPCTSGTLMATLNSSSYTPGSLSSYKVTGLTSRKQYSFCLKAQDAALNISNTTTYKQQLMPDLTAPQFDGLQNVSYDVTTNKFTLVWNPSSSNDINYYKVKVWKNVISPTPAQVTTITYSASTHPSSAVFGTSDFSFTDGDTVFMLVDACDNASPSYNTSDNCTAFAYSTAISKNLIDTTPPPGFLGVSSTVALSQGVIQVNWALPADKSDYAGFKFYNIEETSPGVFSKVFLADTYCVSNSCATTPKTSYNLSVNRDYHTYNIFVSAVDLLGNETKATDAISTLTYSQVTSLDTTKPNFTSSIGSVTASGNINLTWNNATDNQYAKKNVNTPNIITYELYRKTGTTNFNTSTYVNGIPDYVNDTSIIRVASGLTSATYSDSTTPLTQGQTYNYTVCARDQSSNVQCDGFRTVTLADNVPPIIAKANVIEAPNSAFWYLNLNVSDGVNAPGTVITYVYAKYSDNAADFPDGTGAQVSAAMTGAGTVSTPADFVFYQDALTNTSSYHYVNYFIKAVDASSNVTTTTYSHVIRRPTIAASTLTATLAEETLTSLTLTTTGSPAPDLNASDLSYELVTPPSHGTLSDCMNLTGSSGGQDLVCNYIGNAYYFGNDSFTYRVKDSLLASTNVVTVNLTITYVNHNPIATNFTTSTLIGGYNASNTTAINVAAKATDPDNTYNPGTNTLSVVTATPSLANTNFGTVSCSGTTCTVTHPTANMNKYGTTTFPYQVTDGAGGTSSSGTVTLKIYSQYTWTGVVDSNFTNPANWCGSLDASGNCVGASTAPPAGATIVFSDLCTNCNVTIPSTISLNSIILTETFTGTVTVGSGVALSTTLALQAWGGTFDSTNATALTVSGSGGTNTFSVQNAAFKAPSTTFTLNCTGASAVYCFNVDASVGTTSFTHNSGSMILAATGTKNLNANGITLNNLTINNSTYTDQVTLSNGSSSTALSFTTNGNLTVQNGIFTQLASTSSVKVNGNLIQKYASSSNYGTITDLNSTLIGTTASYINMQDSTASAGNITVDQSGKAYSSNTNLTLTSLTIKDGTFNAPTGNLILNGSMYVNNANGALPYFNHNNGTFIFSGSAWYGLGSTFTIPTTFKNVIAQKAYSVGEPISGVMIVEGNLTLDGQNGSSSGWLSNPTSSDVIQLQGNLVVNATSLVGGASGLNIVLTGTNNQSITGHYNSTGGNSYVRSMTTASKTSGNINFYGELQFKEGNVNLAYTNGVIDMGTSTILYSGLGYGFATFTPGSTQFYNVTFTGGYSSGINISGTLNIANNLTLSGASSLSVGATVQGGAINLQKDFTIVDTPIFKTDIYLTGPGSQSLSWTPATGGDQTQMIKSNIYINKPSGTATFATNFNLNYYSKSLILQSGTVDFNGKNVQVNNVTTSAGTVANSWSTLSRVSWTNNGGTQNP